MDAEQGELVLIRHAFRVELDHLKLFYVTLERSRFRYKFLALLASCREAQGRRLIRAQVLRVCGRRNGSHMGISLDYLVDGLEQII